MIQVDRNGGVLRINAVGRIHGANAGDLDDAVRAEMRKDDRAVIVDMSRLSYISSAGLRVILKIARELNESGKTLAVHSLSEPIRNVFEISGFDKVVRVFSTAERARAALAG